MNILKFFLYFILISLLCAFEVNADRVSFEDIKRAASFKDFKSTRKACRVSDYRGRTSSYMSLFSSAHSSDVLQSWLGVSSFDFRAEGDNGNNMATIEKFIQLQKNYVYSDGRKVFMKAMVPCPVYVEEANWGLFDDYKKLEPPRLPVQIQERMKVQKKYDAVMYELSKDNICILMVKMPQASRIYIEGKCKDKDVIIKLSEALSLNSFERKLSN